MSFNANRILISCTTTCNHTPPLPSLDNLSSATVYLAAPKSTYQSPRYRRATTILERSHANTRMPVTMVCRTANGDGCERYCHG